MRSAVPDVLGMRRARRNDDGSPAIIIDIRRELIAAKAEVAHGEWLPWLEAEFGWSETTAQNYMGVARAFKSPTLGDFSGITIDATALYALSAPDVPAEARIEAVARAIDGEHITKKEADEMVSKAAEAECQACEIRLRAEKRAGELLKVTKKQSGARGTGQNQYQVGSQPVTPPPKALAEHGISRNQSAKWQKLADVPEPEFEAALAAPGYPIPARR